MIVYPVEFLGVLGRLGLVEDICTLGRLGRGVSPRSIDLYNLFPLIVRTKSLLASGLLEEGESDSSILQKICYVLNEETTFTLDDIYALNQLVDADTCPSAFLSHLASLIVADLFGSWSVAKQRVVIKGMAFIWLLKCTHLSWKALLRLHTLYEWRICELWKSKIYETDDYVCCPGYEHRIKSARVDLYFATNWHGLSICKMLEQYPDEVVSSGIIDASMTFEYRQWLEDIIEIVRPIHVLLRPPSVDPIDIATDVLNTAQDTDYMGQDAISSVMAVLEDTPIALTDSLSINSACVSWCEGACEGAGCETGCEAYCEGSCTAACQAACETWSCQSTCESGCEYSGCEVVCQMACQMVGQ